MKLGMLFMFLIYYGLMSIFFFYASPYISEEYNSKDTAVQRQPAELYHFWIGTEDHWYYTSGDVAVTYDGNEYLPAALKRGAIKYDEGISSLSVPISIAYINDPILEFIALNPLDIVWIEILKLFRDQDPYQAVHLFTGTIKSVGFKGSEATATCTGFEHFLKRPIPKERYQPTCNEFVYSTKCGLDKDLFCITTTVQELSSDGRDLCISEVDEYPDNHFTWGYIHTGDYYRMIVEHTGAHLFLRYPITADIADTIKIYAGCNGTIEKCHDVFDNVLNFRGHPHVQLDNPVLWTGK